MQIDSLMELPKDKRPPEDIIWDGTSKDIDIWIDRVYGSKGSQANSITFSIQDVEG